MRFRDVLVVEDDADVRRSIEDVLRDEGCRVYGAHDGEHALAILRVIIPDLIVTDLMLPRLTGWELCERLQADRKLRHIPVAVVSAFVDVPPMPGVPFMRKPFDRRGLLALLHSAAGESAVGGTSGTYRRTDFPEAFLPDDEDRRREG